MILYSNFERVWNKSCDHAASYVSRSFKLFLLPPNIRCPKYEAEGFIAKY